MRLIDADALKEKTLAHGEKIAYVVSFLWDIDDSPTIDAIPVEWLRKEMIRCDDNGEMADCDLISWLIQTWHKEQEAR